MVSPGFHQVHRAKPPGVVKGDARPARHMQNDMVMFLRRGVVMVKRADHLPGNQHAPRHAQMDQKRLAGGQIGQNILGPPPQQQHPGPGQARGHIDGQGEPQVGAVDLCGLNHLPLHDRDQTLADGFNLGQFGHDGPMRRDRRAHCRLAQQAYKVTSEQQVQEPMTDNSDKTTHFGFQSVPEADKAGMVHGVFSRVASKYDIMNDLMSGGVHRLWKDAMMDWLAPRPGQRLLDVAGGTGDVAFRFLKRAPGASAVVCDMTEPMLIAGRQRAEADRMADRLEWVVGDAMALPFADASFDVYTISFGIRNVVRIADALAEAQRVLRPGGRLMVLEFSQIPNEMMQKAYDLYSFNVIPLMGQVVAGDRDSYQYLVESIRKFPVQEEFAAMIRAAGFGQVKYRNLTMGVAALHSGWKI